MKNAQQTGVFRAEKAADLMSLNPISVRAEATADEAVALLADRGFSAAPVIDEAGRPVGVLSASDILVHQREQSRSQPPAQPPRVRDLMTPAIFSVAPDTPAEEVVEELVGRKVHQLFVVDDSGVLVGVISALDLVRHLRT